MAINSWLEKLEFHELHPLSVKPCVLNDTYQRERYIVCNDIMVPACFLNLCEVKTLGTGNILGLCVLWEPL